MERTTSSLQFWLESQSRTCLCNYKPQESNFAWRKISVPVNRKFWGTWMSTSRTWVQKNALNTFRTQMQAKRLARKWLKILASSEFFLIKNPTKNWTGMNGQTATKTKCYANVTRKGNVPRQTQRNLPFPHLPSCPDSTTDLNSQPDCREFLSWLIIKSHQSLDSSCGFPTAPLMLMCALTNSLSSEWIN